MGYLSLKNMLKSEFGATKFFCKVDYKPYKMIVNLNFSLSEEGVKSFKDRIVYLENNEAVTSFNENKIYLMNNIENFSYSINKNNRVHIECTLY